MASCFGKNGDNLSAKDYSEKKRNLTLFSYLRQQDELKDTKTLFRTNTATVNKKGNIIQYNNHNNLINYKKAFEECNKEDLKTPYLGQLFKKDECCKLSEIEKGTNITPYDFEKFNPVYDDEDDKKLCFNKNNTISDLTPELITLSVDGYQKGNKFFANHKKINYTCKKPDINNIINVRKDVCCPDKNMWIQMGQDIDGHERGSYSGVTSINSIGNIISVGGGYYDDEGIIRVFQYKGNRWEKIGQKFTGDKNTYSSLNSIGNIIAIRKGGDSNIVQVFQYDGEIWRQLGQDILRRPHGQEPNKPRAFSLNLNSKGNILSICNSNNYKVFKYSDKLWKQMGQTITLDSIGGNQWEFREMSINSDGNIIAVSASGWSNNKGRVQIFKYKEAVDECSKSEWIQLGYNIDGENENDVSAVISLNSEGNIIAIGCGAKAADLRSDDDRNGFVRIFKYDGNTWNNIGEIYGENNENFGWSVSISSDGYTVASGGLSYDKTPNGDDPDDKYHGRIRVFKYNGNTWKQLGNSILSAANRDEWGGLIKLNSDGLILIGSGVSHNNSKGHSRVFYLNEC